MVLVISELNNMTIKIDIYKGFTLLEVLVALSIIATVLGASLRAVASLTQNSRDIRLALYATWSAENRLSQIRLEREWPPLGGRQFSCNQADIQLDCKENILDTPNSAFRKVEVSVFPSLDTERRIIMLSQIVPHEM
jgi:general secretion pathway protein I